MAPVSIEHIIKPLGRIAENQLNQSILFSFRYNDLQARGIFFNKTKTITLGIESKNVAWQICINNENTISSSIPNEAYKIISSSLTDKNSQFTNAPFFNRLVQTLEELINANEINAPQNADIIQLINNCKTKDKKYDNEGEKPFFNHWRRVRPSSQNLLKIQRTFGRDVRESCYQNKTTAVWSATPTETSLSFLNPDQAINEINNCPIN